tara:strand:+ start:19 stop:570 length:552 start_codon:yes stop_codon:yes gene_type:complete
MGQFGNQPDFATTNIKEIVPSATIDVTTFLGAAVIYIGDNFTLGDELKVIPAGTVGAQNTVTNLTLVSGGTGYTTANGVATTVTSIVPASNGAGLTVDTTAAGGIITSVVINAAGANYGLGDIITITGGGVDATFRVDGVTSLNPTAAQAVIFKGLGAGGFLPVTVDYVLTTPLSCGGLISAN